MENRVRWSNPSVLWARKGRDRENWAEEIFGKIMTGILRTDESDQPLFLKIKITSKITRKKSTLGCINMTLQNAKNK